MQDQPTQNYVDGLLFAFKDIGSDHLDQETVIYTYGVNPAVVGAAFGRAVREGFVVEELDAVFRLTIRGQLRKGILPDVDRQRVRQEFGVIGSH